MKRDLMALARAVGVFAGRLCVPVWRTAGAERSGVAFCGACIIYISGFARRSCEPSMFMRLRAGGRLLSVGWVER